MGAVDTSVKAKGFFVLALIQAIFLVSCAICTRVSMNADKEAEEQELKIQRELNYESVAQNEGENSQIMS